MAESDRCVVIVRERPAAAVLAQLHRALGLGVSEVARRTTEGLPLIDRELWLNDKHELYALLRQVLDAVADLDHEVHLVIPGQTLGAGSQIPAETLWNLIRADLDEADVDPCRPGPRT